MPEDLTAQQVYDHVERTCARIEASIRELRDELRRADDRTTRQLHRHQWPRR